MHLCMTDKKYIIVVEDNPAVAKTYEQYLLKEQYQVDVADTGKKALELIHKNIPDLVLLDVKLPDMDGLDLYKQLISEQISTTVVIMTANGSVGIAVEAMKLGAFDFLVKPFIPERLIVTVRNALENNHLKTVVETLKDDFKDGKYCGFIGSSTPMQGVYRIIDSVASSKASVFVTGESGTGKELCAEALHVRSPRRDKNFVALNCAAIPKELIESEIFGHVKGAFTGATSDRMGAAERAQGGTLFLDEICEMDMNLQSKLLRFIQTGIFQKVGDPKDIKVDVRFVCATNRDPLQAVEEGIFREDLYYRLHVVPIELPPLRSREDDVMEIADHFLNEFSKEEHKDFKEFDPAVEELFRSYRWPGNVRELQNVVRNIVVLHTGDVVDEPMIPHSVLRRMSGADKNPIHSKEYDLVDRKMVAQDKTEIRPLWIVEKEIIERAIELNNGNIPRAAAQLEISPSTIYRKKMSWEEQEEQEASQLS